MQISKTVTKSDSFGMIMKYQDSNLVRLHVDCSQWQFDNCFWRVIASPLFDLGGSVALP